MGDPQRRDPYLISGADSGRRTCAAAIDPHLTVADDSVHMALRDTLKLPKQEVIQPLACFRIADQVSADFGFLGYVQKIRLNQ